jgi:hypothetical protein
MSIPSVLGLALAAAAVGVAALLYTKLRKIAGELATARSDLVRFAPILDVEAQVAVVRAELAKASTARDEFLAADKNRRAELTRTYESALATYNRLKEEVSALEENVEAMTYGLYKPHYTFETSDAFKQELDRIYDAKKVMIREGTAASCAIEWTVNDSKVEGRKMTKQNIKVILRAFNGEVDAAVAKVAWNNVTKMEERVRKSFEAINATGTANRISISTSYLEACLSELRATYEYERKKYEEKEEQRRIREQMRDEERAVREAERAEQEAASEETRYEKALARARTDLEKAHGEQLDAANEKVADLERKLAEAHEKMQRAKSLAEQTRSGHVYVLSNVGSFGDRTFKIGMTRRLDPMDRVAELGDASVPFPFDVHAMMFSEDAPGLENAFHKAFADQRVNLINLRKEYFKVSLEEIETFAQSQSVSVQFTKLAEAREYRETLAMREQREKSGAGGAAAQEVAAFPTQLMVG